MAKLEYGEPICGSLAGPIVLVEPHVHSGLNDGRISPQQLAEQGDARGLAHVYFADHDDVRSSEKLMTVLANGGYKVKSALSEEISTLHGHVLAWGLKDRIPHGMSIEKTIYEARLQGAAVGIAHIGNQKIESVSWEKLNELVGTDEEPDAVEVFNGGVDLIESYRRHLLLHLMVPRINTNDAAIDIFKSNPGKYGAPIAGTDTHFTNGVGLKVTGIPAGMDFVEAVKAGKTAAFDSGLVERVTVVDFLQLRARGMRLLFDRRFERNGIIGYKGETPQQRMEAA